MIFRENKGAFDIPDILDVSNGYESCSFQIIGSFDMKNSLIFDEMDLEHSNSCNEQSLSIYEGAGESKTLSEVRC